MSKTEQATKATPLPEWKKNQMEMIKYFDESVIEPMINFAEMIVCYNNPDLRLEKDDIAAIIRLMALGACASNKVYHMCECGVVDPSPQMVNNAFAQWAKDAANMPD